MIRPAVLFSLALLGALPPATARAELRVVAMEGYSVPGEEAGTVFGGVGFPIMNAAGDVAFTGRIGFSDGRSTDAVYRSLGASTARAVAHAGQRPDPVTGTSFPMLDQERPEIETGTLFGTLRLNSVGTVAFDAKLTSVNAADSPIVNRNHSVWRVDQTGKHHLLAQTGQQAPELVEGLVFGNDPLLTFGGGDPFRVVGVDDRDRVTFVGHTADSNSLQYRANDTRSSHVDTGVWQAMPGEAPVRLPTRIEMSEGGVTTYNVIEHEIAILSGAVAYVDRSGRSDFSLYRHNEADGLQLVVDLDSEISGLSGEYTFAPSIPHDSTEPFSGLHLRDDDVVYLGSYRKVLNSDDFDPTDFTPVTDEIGYFGGLGIWASGADGAHLITRDGYQAPGIEGGIVFRPPSSGTGTFTELTANELGGLAFVATFGENDSRTPGPNYNDGTNTGIWAQRNVGELELVVRYGDPTRGLDNGTFFADAQEPQINAEGRVAFVAAIAGSSAPPFPGPNGDYLYGRGIWAEDTKGAITLAVYEGQQIDVSDDPLVEDLRTIRLLGVD